MWRFTRWAARWRRVCATNEAVAQSDLQRGVVEGYSTDEKIGFYLERTREGLRRWEQAVVLTHMPTAGRVLVVGCGTGRESFALEALGWDVAAVDVTPRMVQVARGEAETRQSRVRFDSTDGTLDDVVLDAAVDAVTLWAQVLNNVVGAEGRARLLGNVYRILRPGGVVSLSVHDRDRTLPKIEPDRLVSVDDPEPGDVITAYDVTGPSYNHYVTEPELRSMLSRAGFVEVEVVHTDDLGEAWDNVFVAVARRPA